jgi:hypothetical protein
MFHIKHIFLLFCSGNFFETFFIMIHVRRDTSEMLVGLHIKCVLLFTDLYLKWSVSDFNETPQIKLL